MWKVAPLALLKGRVLLYTWELLGTGMRYTKLSNELRYLMGLVILPYVWDNLSHYYSTNGGINNHGTS